MVNPRGGKFAGMKLIEGVSTLIDAIGVFSDDGSPHVYHFAPRHEGGALVADHPWDDSYEATSCEHCAELE